MSTEITTTGENQLSFGFWANFMALFGWGTLGRVAKSAKLIARARERAALQSDEAVKQAITLYTRAIDLLTSTNGMDRERHILLGPALLNLGKLQQQVQEISGALTSYLEAKKLLTSIPRTVLEFIAATLARKRDLDAAALAIYVELLEAYRGQDKPVRIQGVYSFLESSCTVEERTPLPELQQRIPLCERAINTDPSLEWAHYYRGLAHFVQRQFREALKSCSRAKDLKSGKPLLDFYIEYSAGMCELEQDRYEPAAGRFRKANSAGPKRPDSRFALGKSLVCLCNKTAVQTKDCSAWITEAVSNLEQAVQWDPRQAEYAFYLGQAYCLANQIERAAKAFQQAVSLDDHKADYFLELGKLLYQLGKAASARDAARSAIALDKDCIPAHRLYAVISLEEKQFEEAEREFRLVLQTQANDVEVRTGLGKSLYLLGRFADALPILEPAYRKNPDAAFYLARCYAQTNSFGKAVEHLESLTTQQPTFSQAFHYLALGYAHLQRFSDALRAFGKAIELDQENSRSFFYRGHALVKLGSLQEARTDYETALRLRPKDVEVAFQLGCVCRVLKDDSAAAAHLEHVVKLSPRHLDARLVLGMLHEGLGDMNKALKQYSAAAEIDPKSSQAYRRSGVLRCRRGDFLAAEKDLQKARELGDDCDEILQYLGLTAARTNNFAATLSYWKPLSERHPDDQRLALNMNRLHYLLGKQHVEAKRYADAITEWSIYLEPRPNDDDLKKQIAALHFGSAIQIYSDKGSGAASSAKAAILQAMSLESENSTYRYYAALFDLASGKTDAFIAATQSVLPQLDASLQVHARYHLGVAWLAQNDPQKAESYFTNVGEATGRNGQSLDVRLPLAVVYAKTGRWEQAADMLNAGLPS